MIKFLLLKKFSPKRMLKGEDYLKKEQNSIHNALFLPITIISSFCYLAAHSNIPNHILWYTTFVFAVVYYILLRLLFTYRLQKHLATTIPDYHPKNNLWCINWNDEALQIVWREKLQELRKCGKISHEKHLQVLHTFTHHNTTRWAYAGLILLIITGIFFALLLVPAKSHHKLTEPSRNRRRAVPTKIYPIATKQTTTSHYITTFSNNNNS